MKYNFVVLYKSLITGVLFLLTGCLSAPEVKPIPDGVQPESLYSPNYWTYHKPYDIWARIAPIIGSVNAINMSLSQSINNAYNIQAAQIAAENKRLISGYQYTNQTYYNRLENERQQKLIRLQELEAQQQQKNLKANMGTYNVPQSSKFNPGNPLDQLFDPDSGFLIDVSGFIIEGGQGIGSGINYQNCTSNNLGVPAESQETCKR